MSKNSNEVPSSKIERTVAEIGSTQAMSAAFVGPIILIPSMYKVKATIVPKNTTAKKPPNKFQV